MSKECVKGLSLLKRANPKRYSSLITNLENDFALGVDKYPFDLTSA